MDDVIYSDLKRHTVMPIQMALLNSDTSNLQLMQTTVQGTGRFMYNLAPRGAAFKDSAKELMLKDADYSTPTDHYFSHLQRMKEDDDYASKAREHDVLEGLDITEE